MACFKIVVSQAWVKVWQIFSIYLDLCLSFLGCSYLFREDLNFCDRSTPFIIRICHTDTNCVCVDFIKTKVGHFTSSYLIWSFKVCYFFPVIVVIKDMVFTSYKAWILRNCWNIYSYIVFNDIGLGCTNTIVFVKGYIEVIN